MKNKLFICLTLSFLVLLSVNGYAQDKNSDNSSVVINSDNICYEKTPLNKLGRGALNIVTCWAEIPGDVMKVSNEKNGLAGITLGLVEGIFTTLIRGITGVYDVVTFVIPPYSKPLMEPEYAWQSMTDKCTQYSP